jgi:hypothetical protein
MRLPAVAAIVSCVLVAGCVKTGLAVAPKTDTAMIPRPLVARELDGLLLSAQQIDDAMKAPAMAVVTTETSMSDDSTTLTPPECLALDGAAEAAVYSNTGFSAERGQSFNDGDHFTHYLKQAVVTYPVVEKATAFLDHSARQWQTCSQYTHLQSRSHWSVGPVAYANGMLSALVTEQEAAAPGWACARALTVSNNVVIDVNTCSADPADSAVMAAQQIAARVAATW